MKIYLRTTKAAARKAFNKGDTNIAIQSSLFAPDGVWSQACEIDNSKGYDFDELVLNFKWYNCTSETGKGVHFYTFQVAGA